MIRTSIHCGWICALLVISQLSSANEPDASVATLSISSKPEQLWDIPRQELPVQIVVDGLVTEEEWQTARVHEQFHVVNRDPDDLHAPRNNTKVLMFYTDRGLYAAAIMEQDPATFVKRLSAKDGGSLVRDFFTVGLDTSGEGTYGYYFTICLGDTKLDGTLRPPRAFLRSWDGAWWGKSQINDKGWTAELFIPWNVMNMPQVSGERVIGLYLSRNVPADQEHYAWPAIHFNSPVMMTILQPIRFQEVEANQQLSVFPYIASTMDQREDSSLNKVGADLFWRPSANFQLTAAAKPDFGTVETDAVVINLSAYETFLQEKRLFFQEGIGVFKPTERSIFFGNNSPVLLLHTRRIGAPAIFPDLPQYSDFDYDQFARASEILAATKATGQVGSLRYGLLGAIEGDSNFHGTVFDDPFTLTQSGRDFGVVRLLYENSSQSNKSIGFMSTDVRHPERGARTHGVDGRYQTTDGKYWIESQLLMSDIDGEADGYGGFVDFKVAHNSTFQQQFAIEHFDRRIDLNDIGFLPRNDYRQLSAHSYFQHYDIERFQEVNSRITLDYRLNSRDERIGSSARASSFMTLQNQNTIWIGGTYNNSAIDDRNSFNNGSYRLDSSWNLGLDFGTDSAKRFSTYSWIGIGSTALNGRETFAHTSFNWRPVDRIWLRFQFDMNRQEAWLLHQFERNFTGFDTKSRNMSFGLEYFFSANQHVRLNTQWSAFRAVERSFYVLPIDSHILQEIGDPNLTRKYDFAISRLNFQVRYRWEIAPLSDLYVVYTKSASLPDALGRSFTEALVDTFDFPVEEFIAIKLRYRIGAGSTLPTFLRRRSK